MTTTDAAATGVFEPPGPGSWGLDPVHFPRPVTRYWAEVNPAPFRRGTAEFARYYGLLVGGMESAYVNGFAYNRLVPVDDSVVPERFQRAAEVYAGRLWRDQLREWDDVAKPTSVREHRQLQSVDPDALSDAELSTYLMRCRSHHEEMGYQHMRFTGAATLPVGDLLVHAQQWTDVGPAAVLNLTRGAAPVSAGASEQLDRLHAAFAGDQAAREVLASDDEPARILDQLRGSDGEVSGALTDYLDLVGFRLLDGFDISGRYALELPDALVRAIRSSVSGRTMTSSHLDEQVTKVRDKVPAEHRAEFDELLGEARLMSRLRDERGVYSDIWASGIMRRAALFAGRRLALRGRIHEAEHLIDAGPDEMVQLLAGSGEPSADELAARAAYRLSHSSRDAPPFLGTPPEPPPPLDGLPPAAARVMAALGAAFGELFGSSQLANEEGRLRGLAASRGLYEGPARRVSGPTEFDRIQDGDVLVTESTSEAFNILLPLLGAIVTDSGGLLSHSAIVAREYGIPGVVGTREATQRIRDGQLVRVDGDAGEVTILP